PGNPPRSGAPRVGGVDRRDDCVALVKPGRDPALVPSQLDIPSRSRLRAEGWPRARPLCRHLGRRAPDLHRLRDLDRREDHIQARGRKHATLAPRPGRSMRVEHEYKRLGAWTYLAAWDVRRAKIYGRCMHKMGIAAFDGLVEQVMSHEPYRSATRVFWIMDHFPSHRGERCAERLRKRWPAIIVVHTPLHASWLNQVEIYF